MHDQDEPHSAADRRRYTKLRDAVASTGRRLEQDGLVSGTAGNVSARVGPRVVAITPSGLPYKEIGVEDVVLTDLSGKVVEGRRNPSTELPFHLAVYRARPDVCGVVHTHSPFATVLASMRRPIPALHYAIAEFAVAEITVVPYETYGSLALARQVEKVATSGANGALLANHGAITFARSLERAAALASLLEFLAATYYRTLVAGGPVVLRDDEIRRVMERHKDYGQTEG